MSDEMAIIFAIIISVVFSLSCGIFCLICDYKRDELNRMIRKKEKERNGT